MNRRTFLSGSAFGGATLLALGVRADAAEWTPLERGVLEHKYYVKGVGNVRTIMVKGGSEEEHLVSITR